jgi:PAS domain S-box-containing protein
MIDPREEDLFDFIENAPMGLNRIDPDGTILWANKTELEMIGYAREEYVGRKIAEFHADPEAIADIQERLARNETIHDREAHLRCKDGSVRHVLISSNVVRRDGKFVGTRCYTRDITVRKEVERALREADERLKIALHAGRMGGWEWDIRTGKVSWTPGLEAIHGLPPAGFGGGFEDFKRDIHPEDLEKVMETIARTLRERKDYWIEYRIIRPDGRIAWLEGRGRLFLDEKGAPERMVGICMEISDRKWVEIERERILAAEQRARAEAQAASRAKDEFLATISHELRTPLNAILGWSQVLLSGKFHGNDLPRALESIVRNARSQAQLIEDILDVSRIITGRLRLDIRNVDLLGIIGAALDALRHAAESKSIQIKTILQPDVGPVRGDPDRLQHVVWNLFSNAIKFTPEEGEVAIKLERIDDDRGGYAQIVVSDTGKGIPAEFLPFVFDRFRQGDGSNTRRHDGLGLGLAIVRHLMELHGGTVQAESRGAGQGATFTLKLPLLGASVSGAEVSRPLGEAASVSKAIRETFTSP